MGKKKGKAEPEPEVPTGPPPPPPDLRNYVTLQLKLMNWKFTDCSIVVPSEETHLFTIKKRLEAMHGRMKGLVICKDSYAERNELEARRELLAQAMDVLNDREKDILTQRRLAEQPVTLEELSGTYDVSRERIRQIEVRAFEKLQKRMRELAQDQGMLAGA